MPLSELQGERFDTIVGLAPIEHLPDPLSFLKQVCNFLTPHGRIALTTPNLALDWAHGLGSRIARASHDEHQSLMGRKTIERHANDAGLKLFAYRRFLLGANQLAVLTRA